MNKVSEITVNYYAPLLTGGLNRHCVVRDLDTLVVNVHTSQLRIHVATSSIDRMDKVMSKVKKDAPFFLRGDGSLSVFTMQEYAAGSEDFEPKHIAGCEMFSIGDIRIVRYLDLINQYVFENQIPENILGTLMKVMGVSQVEDVHINEHDDVPSDHRLNLGSKGP